MSSLLYLTSKDFKVEKGTKGDVMCHNIRGFTLVLFYSTQCVYCQTLIPIFKKLPGTLGGCQFGICNVSKNKSCVMMSQNTIAPIKYVPYIVLYVDGRPFMRYNGPHNDQEIRRFVFEVANKLTHNQKFTNKVKKAPDGRSIPEYTIGKPLYGPNKDQVCYLNFGKAYQKKN